MSKIVTKVMSLEGAKELGIDGWSSWECEPSKFDWVYPANETAYVFEGDVVVTSGEEQTHICGGMLVTFPKGMKCTWEVREKIRKVYTFH